MTSKKEEYEATKKMIQDWFDEIGLTKGLAKLKKCEYKWGKEIVEEIIFNKGYNQAKKDFQKRAISLAYQKKGKKLVRVDIDHRKLFKGLLKK